MMIQILWYLLIGLLFYYQVYNAAFGEIPYFSILCLCFLCAGMLIFVWRRRVKIPKDLFLYAFFILYSFVFGILIAPDKGFVVSAMVEIIKYFVISVVLYFLVVYMRRGAEKVAYLVACNETILALLFPLKGVAWQEDTNRIEFLYRVTNIVAIELFIGFIALVYLYLLPGNKKKRPVYWMQAATILGGILLTGSRKLLVGILGVICIYYFLLFVSKQVMMRKKIKMFLLLLPAAPISIIYLLHFTYLGKRFFIPNDGDLYRKALFNDGMKLFLEHPLLGVGFNNFRHYNHGVYSHSVFSELLSCTGVLGMILYLVFFLAELYLAFLLLRKLQASKADRRPVYFIIATLITMLILGAVQLHFYYFYYYIFIGFVSGVLHSEIKKRTEKQE